MKKTLAELFEEAAGPVVRYEGLTVHGAVFRHVKAPGRFLVRFISAVTEPVQALRINITPGVLMVADEQAQRMILRLDTSPKVVEVRYQPSRDGSKITLYNAWINEDGQTDAWLMHAGMLVEEKGNKTILHCSDGRGDPTFDDLIMEVEFFDD